MTRLDCTVGSCLYNKEQCCCKDNIEVVCKACDCTFNEDCRCTAKHIGIAGGAACDCKDTECATFRCRCE